MTQFIIFYWVISALILIGAHIEDTDIDADLKCYFEFSFVIIITIIFGGLIIPMFVGSILNNLHTIYRDKVRIIKNKQNEK